jgi:carbon-monoxide dehydrogenase large subunit
MIQSETSARVLTGVYDIGTVFVNAQGIYTNTAPVDAYRGAGRPEAIYTLERVIDHAAREIGLDPWALRERNFVRTFPYATASGELYDVGDFPRVVARVRREAGVAGFAARRAEAAGRGRLRGLGLCVYIESIYVGTQSNGQGHETVLAHFLADRSGIPAEQIEVVQGDSDLIARGGGTGGSRSVTVQGTATIAVIEKMAGAFAPFLAEELGAEGFAFDGAAFRAPGTNHAITMLEAAALARKAGRADLLDHRTRARLPGRSYPNGAHVAEVEIDPETGHLAILRYTVTDDFGVLIHPQLAEGQVHGGIAQGVGQAVSEHAVHDRETGQLLTATFMDYGMPRADTLPMITFTTEPVPSTANPIGMKGCGEAGTVGALAAVANAVVDALAPLGVPAGAVQMPFTPLRLWRLIHERGRRAAE